MSDREKNFTGPVIAAVGAVVFRGDEVLVIRRGRAPLKGQWSIPGGKVEYGERLHDALAREVREETGVEIRVLGLLDVFESLPSSSQDRGPADEAAPAEDAATRLSASENKTAPHYVMIDYAAEWIAGEPRPGDDAETAEFVSLEEAERRIAWDTTRRAVARAAEWRRQNPGKGRAQGPTLS
jgi:8-oxo-dGTP diphosphatase